jgi:hypothetical protein
MIVPVIATNHFIQYKTVSFGSNIITFLGGNLFLDNPLCVIAWYITFIIMLYLYAFIEFLLPRYKLYLFFISCFLFYFFLISKFLFFIAFVLGLRINFIKLQKRNFNKKILADFSGIVFGMQKYCYSFFLIHGGILLFFNIMKSSFYFLENNYLYFMFSLACTVCMSVIFYQIVNYNLLLVMQVVNNFGSSDKRALSDL